MAQSTRLLLCVSLAATLAAGWRTPAAAAKRAPPQDVFIGVGEGYQPPEFSGTDLAGAPHTLKAYAGQVLVLHFWASWCPYCRSEIEELVKLSGPDWTAKGVRVLAVSSDEDPAKLRQFLAQQPLPYPIIADVESKRSIGAQYGVRGIPVTIIIGRNGQITSRLDGAGEIIEAVQRALQLPSSSG